MPIDSPLPGSLTVPPLHGWVGIVVLLVLAAVVGVAFLVAGTISRSASGTDEWQSWLAGRSRSAVDAEQPASEPVPHHSRT